MQKLLVENVPFYPKYWVNVTALERNRRSASAVTPSDKSSIITNRKSATRFAMSPRWTSYVVPKPPNGGSKNAKCPKFEQLAAIFPKRYEIGRQLLLITNRKSHTRFRLVPTSMTLDDLERRNSPYLAFFRRFRFLCWSNTSQWLNICLLYTSPSPRD